MPVLRTSLQFVLLLVSLPAVVSADPIIDGSTVEAFTKSHVALMAALSPEDKLRFSLAEIVYISRFHCSEQREPIPNQPDLTRVTGGMTKLSACRAKLNGKSFRDIMALGGPKRAGPVP